MKIYPERINYKPTWVSAQKFNFLWKKTDNGLFVDSWEGEPSNSWFKYDMDGNRLGFKTADVSFDIEDGKQDVEFTNGRHRTRWQLQQNNAVISIGLTEEGFTHAQILGLEPVRII